MEYTIIIEYAGGKYTAYAPDIPGCVATGATVDEARRSMQEALVLHLAMLREMGFRVLDAPAFGVQHHPEAGPGPHDASYLFDQFTQLMTESSRKVLR